MIKLYFKFHLVVFISKINFQRHKFGLSIFFFSFHMIDRYNLLPRTAFLNLGLIKIIKKNQAGYYRDRT